VQADIRDFSVDDLKGATHIGDAGGRRNADQPFNGGERCFGFIYLAAP